MIVGLTGKVLPIHPQPKPDEIFSSWYCRVAKANSMKLHTLEVKLWGRDKQIWTRDIDRSIDDATLEHFAGMCGTPIERARETRLKSYEGIVFLELNQTGHSSWILPSGVYHRKRLRSGMQFCPHCLATDREQYFRKSWRLAFSTVCELHGCMLHDCCPECQAPVTFHRHEMGERWSWQVESLVKCSQCGFDLSRAVPCDAPVAEIHAFLTLRHQLSFLDWGWTFAGDETFQYSHLYFGALRNLLCKLRSGFEVRRLLDAAQRELGITVEWLSPPSTPFESHGIVERHCLLQIAIWLLRDWPTRFLRVAREANIRHSELMRDFDGDPFWFKRGVAPLEVNPIGPNPLEREAMRNLLVDALDDKIRLDRLKRQVKIRFASRPLRELWIDDGLAFTNELRNKLRYRPKVPPKAPRRVIPEAAVDWEELAVTSGIPVAATVQRKQNFYYALRVVAPSLQVLLRWFPRDWSDVEIEFDGEMHVARLGTTSRDTARELRCRAIQPWLQARGLAEWRLGCPPKFKLLKLEGRQFRLLA